MSELRLAFAGTPDFAARHLSALLAAGIEPVVVLTQPDRRAGRGKRARPGAVKALAEEVGLPVLQPASLRPPEAVEELRALELDALVVVAYGLLLPQNVLDLPRYGCINVHGSLLPRWRGAAPVQRAIEAGDRETGVSIMLLDAGLDTGPVLATQPCPIAPLATSADLYEQLAALGPALLLDVLGDLPAHLAGARDQDQDQESATYAKKIEKSEALLNWSEPAAVLARKVRAFNPAPGCFTFLSGQRIKVWMARPLPGGAEGAPGVILQSSDRGIAVCCADGILLLESLQLPGSRAMSAAQLLRGHGALLQPGARFDNGATA